MNTRVGRNPFEKKKPAPAPQVQASLFEAAPEKDKAVVIKTAKKKSTKAKTSASKKTTAPKPKALRSPKAKLEKKAKEVRKTVQSIIHKYAPALEGEMIDLPEFDSSKLLLKLDPIRKFIYDLPSELYTYSMKARELARMLLRNRFN